MKRFMLIVLVTLASVRGTTGGQAISIPISNVSPPSPCGSNYLLQWGGTSWDCAALEVVGNNLGIGLTPNVGEALQVMQLPSSSTGTSYGGAPWGYAWTTGAFSGVTDNVFQWGYNAGGDGVLDATKPYLFQQTEIDYLASPGHHILETFLAAGATGWGAVRPMGAHIDLNDPNDWGVSFDIGPDSKFNLNSNGAQIWFVDPTGATAHVGAGNNTLQLVDYVTRNTGLGNAYFGYDKTADGWVFSPPLAGSGGVTSFSGDGTVLSNSGSTGAATATLASAGPYTVLQNDTSSSAAPTYGKLDLTNATTGSTPVANGGTGTALGEVFLLTFGSTVAFKVNEFIGFGNYGASESCMYSPMAAGGTADTMTVYVSATPGRGTSWTVTLRKCSGGVGCTPGNASFSTTDTGDGSSGTCVITGTTHQQCTVSGGSTTFAVGDFVDLEFVSSGGTPAPTKVDASVKFVKGS